jgi:hypothetical protein
MWLRHADEGANAFADGEREKLWVVGGGRIRLSCIVVNDMGERDAGTPGEITRHMENERGRKDVNGDGCARDA